MKTYNFDTITPRRGTDSLKYDRLPPRGRMPADMLSMWVADMDLRTADPVAAALKNLADFGIYGYTEPGDAYRAAVRAWWRERHSFDFDARSIIVTPGVVFALAQAVRAFSEPGDAILIQRPVYYPFTEVIADNKRRICNSPLRLTDEGRYVPDFEDFERRLAEDRPKLFLLCSPHNPVGRVWTKEELRRMGELCAKYDCIVVSDEIHADFVYAGSRHTVFTTVDESFRENSIVCTSPSKSFNLAGLQISNIVAEDAALRKRLRDEINAGGYSQANIMGLAACRAAYEEGGPWFDELLAYLSENLAVLREAFPPSAPERSSGGAASPIRLVEPEGTYLPWLDFRGLGLTQDEADRRLLENAKIWLDSGSIFGPEGDGFQRMNIACPRSVVKDAAVRIAREFSTP